jgi:hypothetical protein
VRSIVVTLAAFAAIATRSIQRLTDPLAPGIGGMGTPHSPVWAPVGISAASLAQICSSRIDRLSALPSISRFFGSAFAGEPCA